jgi:hypothetical protein
VNCFVCAVVKVAEVGETDTIIAAGGSWLPFPPPPQPERKTLSSPTIRKQSDFIVRFILDGTSSSKPILVMVDKRIS